MSFKNIILETIPNKASNITRKILLTILNLAKQYRLIFGIAKFIIFYQVISSLSTIAVSYALANSILIPFAGPYIYTGISVLLIISKAAPFILYLYVLFRFNQLPFITQIKSFFSQLYFDIANSNLVKSLSNIINYIRSFNFINKIFNTIEKIVNSIITIVTLFIVLTNSLSILCLSGVLALLANNVLDRFVNKSLLFLNISPSLFDFTLMKYIATHSLDGNILYNPNVKILLEQKIIQSKHLDNLKNIHLQDNIIILLTEKKINIEELLKLNNKQIHNLVIFYNLIHTNITSGKFIANISLDMIHSIALKDNDFINFFIIKIKQKALSFKEPTLENKMQFLNNIKPIMKLYEQFQESDKPTFAQKAQKEIERLTEENAKAIKIYQEQQNVGEQQGTVDAHQNKEENTIMMTLENLKHRYQGHLNPQNVQNMITEMQRFFDQLPKSKDHITQSDKWCLGYNVTVSKYDKRLSKPTQNVTYIHPLTKQEVTVNLDIIPPNKQYSQSPQQFADKLLKFNQEEANKQAAARRCADRIFDSKNSGARRWKFDINRARTEQLNFLESICLVWIAIHDDKEDVLSETGGSLGKKLDGLIYQFYSGQRLYNSLKDDHNEIDNPACLPGIRNRSVKAIETFHIDFIRPSLITKNFLLQRIVDNKIFEQSIIKLITTLEGEEKHDLIMLILSKDFTIFDLDKTSFTKYKDIINYNLADYIIYNDSIIDYTSTESEELGYYADYRNYNIFEIIKNELINTGHYMIKNDFKKQLIEEFKIEFPELNNITLEAEQPIAIELKKELKLSEIQTLNVPAIVDVIKGLKQGDQIEFVKLISNSKFINGYSSDNYGDEYSSDNYGDFKEIIKGLLTDSIKNNQSVIEYFNLYKKQAEQSLDRLKNMPAIYNKQKEAFDKKYTSPGEDLLFDIIFVKGLENNISTNDFRKALMDSISNNIPNLKNTCDILLQDTPAHEASSLAA